MKNINSIEEVFKPYVNPSSAYKGGKSIAEVAAMTTAEKIFKLSSNENALGSSPKAMEAITAHKEQLYQYSPVSDDRFREALAEFYNIEMTPDQFVTSNSGVAMIELIIRAFMSEGLECIMTNPAFGPYDVFPRKLGAKVRDIPLIGDDFRLDVEGIIGAINEKTRIIFLTSPNNPTGSYITKQQVDQIVNNAPPHVVIVYDEVYYQYVDKEDYTRGYPYVKEGQNVIAVNSFSKAYGLAGLRVGYAYSTAKIAKYISAFRRPFMINTLSMEAAIAALKDEEWIQKTASLNKAEKQYLYEEYDELGLKYWKTQANFIAIKPKMGDLAFTEAMLLEGIMVRPVAGFGFPGVVRITIGDHKANVACVKAIKKVLKSGQ